MGLGNFSIISLGLHPVGINHILSLSLKLEVLYTEKGIEIYYNSREHRFSSTEIKTRLKK